MVAMPITEEQRRDAERMVRQDGAGVRTIARHFGVDRRTAHRIVDPIRQEVALAAQRAEQERRAAVDAVEAQFERRLEALRRKAIGDAAQA